MLRSTQLTGLLAGGACTLEQQLVCPAQQTEADRQTLRVTQLPLSSTKSAQVVCDLLDVVCVADLRSRFRAEQIDECGLRALD